MGRGIKSTIADPDNLNRQVKVSAAGEMHVIDSGGILCEGGIEALTAGAATFTMDIPSGENEEYFNWHAAVEFYSDSAGTPSTPTSGTITFTVEKRVLPDVFQILEWTQLPTSAGQGVVDLSVRNEQVNWATGGVHQVRVVLASIAGGSTTHFQLRVRGESD